MAVIPRGSKFRVFVYDPAVKRSVSIGTFATINEARQAEEDAEAAKNVGVFVTPSKLTVAEFINDQWLPAVELRTSTGAATYEYHAARLINGINGRPGLGQLRLQKLTPARITQLYGDFIAEGLSPAYVHHLDKSLRNVLALAVKYKALPRNVALDAQRPAINDEPEEGLVVWSSAELQTLFAFMEYYDVPESQVAATDLRNAWFLQATTGLRRCEVLPLRWEGVDLERAELVVARSLPPRKGGLLEPKRPKSKASRRTVALFPETVKVLREQKLAGYSSDLVFSDKHGGYINPSTYSQRLYSVCKQAGVTPHRSHAFRHTHATILLRDLGWDIYRVKERLGHHSVKVTEVYLHYVTKDQHDAIERSGPFLGELNGLR